MRTDEVGLLGYDAVVDVTVTAPLERAQARRGNR